MNVIDAHQPVAVIYLFRLTGDCFIASQLCSTSGDSLGYGFSRVMSKTTKSLISDDESEPIDGALAI